MAAIFRSVPSILFVSRSFVINESIEKFSVFRRSQISKIAISKILETPKSYFDLFCPLPPTKKNIWVSFGEIVTLLAKI